MTMKKTIILMLACMCVFMNASAQRNSGRLSLGVGLLYENGNIKRKVPKRITPENPRMII